MQASKRILCVEPSTDICELVQLMLHERGYVSDAAATIADALTKAQTGAYDLYILNDWYKDGTSGELSTRLRALTPLVPILVFTAQAYAADRQKALAAGAAAVLIKPGDIDLLPQTINQLLAASSA